jgi:hypothetical protein
MHILAKVSIEAFKKGREEYIFPSYVVDRLGFPNNQGKSLNVLFAHLDFPYRWGHYRLGSAKELKKYYLKATFNDAHPAILEALQELIQWVEENEDDEHFMAFII